MRNIFLTVLVILSACSSSETPEDVLSKEQMVQVLMEVHILEAKMDNVPVEPYDSTQAVYEHFEKLLFEEQGITQEQYERSFNYYIDHPNDLEKIYNAVVDSLMARQNRYK